MAITTARPRARHVAARHPGGSRRYPAWSRALAGFIVASAAFGAIFITLTLSGFHEPTPHDLPVGIVGPAAVTTQVEHALDRAAPGAFRFSGYPSAARATTAIAQRDVDGALVASGPNLRLLVAQAGGNASMNALTGAFTALAQRSGVTSSCRTLSRRGLMTPRRCRPGSSSSAC